MQIFNNFDLTKYNSYRIQARCKMAYFPTCEEDFVEIYSKHNKNEIVTLGGGWNVILSRDYYDKVFVIIGESFSNIEKIGKNMLECEAGVDTKKFSEFALRHALSGVEIYYDIPSSIGGAVVMNAGTKEMEIKDILVKVRYLDLTEMQIKEIDKEDIGFEYRNSFFQKNTDKIVLKAWFKLNEGNSAAIHQKMENVKQKRWAKQPKKFPNAGSVFKRPPGKFVGPMIDELGLKGYTIGGAQISEKHSGFIVNFSEATGEDILAIISEVKQRVHKRFGVDLEVEQRVI